MAPQDEQPDAFHEVITRVHQGDESAWRALVRLYEPGLLRAAEVLLGPVLRASLDPMDLVQSVHLLLITGLRQQKYDISTPKQLLALAIRLLRCRIARYWERQQRRGDRTKQPLNLSFLVSPQENDPARAAQDHDEIEHLLHNLDETERHLVELRLQGYNTAEVARELHLDPNVLRVRLSRLRKRLRATLSFQEGL
jgi:RNA polymerase sigma factor (sigma-70 family)